MYQLPKAIKLIIDMGESDSIPPLFTYLSLELEKWQQSQQNRMRGGDRFGGGRNRGEGGERHGGSNRGERRGGSRPDRSQN